MILVKLGGTLLDSADMRASLAAQIARAQRHGNPVVVVHGGGKQMTRYLTERGIESRFVNGLRVTTDEVIDAVLKVFAGTVNAELVSSLRAAGANPVRHADLRSSPWKWFLREVVKLASRRTRKAP